MHSHSFSRKPAWKELAQKQQAQGPLRQHLLHHLMQDALHRFSQLQKANATDEIWQKALKITDDQLRRHLAVSHVRCEAEAADQDIAAWDPYGSDAPSAAGNGGNLSRQPADPQVQSSEEDQRYLPMAHPGDSSQQQTLGDSGSTVPQQHVVDDLGETPPTPTEIESIGAAAGEGLTRPIMIPEALDACLRLQMQNQGNDCSVHANVQAFLWGAFRCEHLMWSDFGHVRLLFRPFCPPSQQAFFFDRCQPGMIFGRHGVDIPHRGMR